MNNKFANGPSACSHYISSVNLLSNMHTTYTCISLRLGKSHSHQFTKTRKQTPLSKKFKKAQRRMMLAHLAGRAKTQKTLEEKIVCDFRIYF